MSVHKIFFFYSLLCLDSRIFARDLDHVYALDQLFDETYKMPENILRRTFYKKAFDDDAIIWDRIEHKNDGNSDEKDLRIFYKPSVPAPKKRARGDSAQLRHSLYGRLFTRRNNRATQAGYTNNVDTCELYNTNLEKVWMALAKFIGPNVEMPDSMALHNIMLLVKAYLDHHSLLVKKDKNIQRQIDNTKQGNVSEILNEINEILVKNLSKNDEEMTSKIIALIISRTKILKGNDSEKCNELRKEKLKLSVKREYRRFIEFSNCRRVNKIEMEARENFRKMSLSDVNEFLREWKEDPDTNCIIFARKTFLDTLRVIIDEYIIDIPCLE